MSRWQAFVEARAYAWRLGVVMFSMAIAVTLGPLLAGRAQLTAPAGAMLAIMGMWAFNMYGVATQMRYMQARVDMLRAGRGEKPE